MAKKNIKPILPSLREKKRYLAFEAITGSQIDFKKAKDDISKACIDLHGTLGTSKIGALFLENKWNSASKTGIVKVGHKHVDDLKAALCAAGSNEVIYRSLGVSGILKKAENKFIKTKEEK